jgi:predicted O-methyltransferase YrrM
VSEGEPTSEREARAWIARQTREVDVFHALAEETERHRVEHGCTAYATGDGPLLGTLARALGARRVLEVGTALGYSAAWLAHGAGSGCVDTVEADPSHAAIAERALARAGVGERVRIHVGRSPRALAGLEPGYDLVFYDADVPTPSELEAFHGLLRPGGLLVTSNLFLGQYGVERPGLAEGARYRRELFDPTRWLTAFADLKALSVKV